MDVDGRTIALSGELGSGKSSVAERVARALGARWVSTGEAQRQIAEKRGISTLELNRQAETDPSIDEQIDSVFRSLASVRESLVVDSRLAWHFLPRAFKVHLVVDPAEAASRVLRRTGSRAEQYDSIPEALSRMSDRVESEQRRFQIVYGIDIFRLRNYDLVVDTTQATPAEVADRVLASFAAGSQGAMCPAMFLAPERVHPATAMLAQAGEAGVEKLVDEIHRHGISHLPPIAVAYSRPVFSLLGGEEVLQAAKRCGLTLVPAELQAEDDEPIPPC